MASGGAGGGDDIGGRGQGGTRQGGTNARSCPNSNVTAFRLTMRHRATMHDFAPLFAPRARARAHGARACAYNTHACRADPCVRAYRLPLTATYSKVRLATRVSIPPFALSLPPF